MGHDNRMMDTMEDRDEGVGDTTAKSMSRPGGFGRRCHGPQCVDIKEFPNRVKTLTSLTFSGNPPNPNPSANPNPP